MEQFTEIFSNKAENYDKSRPHYPAEFLEFFHSELQFSSEKTVADIGSGTGISTEIFLENGNKTFAIEPNDDMRLVAEKKLSENKNFISLNATAENTNLDNESIDLVFAGTAFHWFEPIKTKAEFNRILKPNGNIVLAWIARDMEDSLQMDMEAVYDQFTTEIDSVEQQEAENIIAFFAPKTPEIKHIPHHFLYTWKQFLGRASSSSYYPKEDEANYKEITTETHKIFDKHQTDGFVKFKYITTVYWV